MSKFTYIALIVMAFLFIFSACEKIVYNVDLPRSDPKLVVFSYISPTQDTLFAVVTTSRPITEVQSSWEPRYVKNATVTIKETGSQSVSLLYDNKRNIYFAPRGTLVLSPGKQYEINATTPDGKRVTAMCIVPPRNSSVRITKVDSVDQGIERKYKIRIEFDDLPGEPSYYSVSATAQEDYGSMPPPWGYYEHGIIFDYGKTLIDARQNDGKTFVLEGSYSVYRVDISSSSRLRGLRVKLLSVDEPYYRFHRSYNIYDGDNPFSEPVILYSNITGGLGVFSAFNQHEIYYPLRPGT